MRQVSQGSWFLAVLILSFSGCSKKNASGEDAKRVEQCAIHQARLSDIPVPVGFTFTGFHEQGDALSGNVGFSYAGMLQRSSVLTFYERNMERLGWDIRNLSSGSEGLLFCFKPGKMCAVSIRDRRGRNKSVVTLFVHKDSA